ncbi:MAG TPA: DUF4192 domain-containing protein [Kineosporiaceae bacterium]|nr:DUF4192 domain-containing protein [Kineosporiaceae bacterium]
MTTHQPHEEPCPASTGALETVRLRDAQDLLTAVPYLLGFHPSDCVVVLALDGAGRLLVTVRTDLPTAVDIPQAVSGLEQALRYVEATELVLVGYCHLETAPLLAVFAEALPWPTRDLLLVQQDRWWSLSCLEQDCCPQGELMVPQDCVAAPMIAASGAPAASRTDLAASLAGGPDHLLDQVVRQLTTTPPMDTAERYAAAGKARAARRDGSVPMPPDRAAVLLLAVRDVMVRDACTIWHDEETVRLWLDLLPAAPPGWVAPVATLLAAAVYQRGDGALAVLALERALADDPGYGLARLLQHVATIGVPPNALTHVLTQALENNPLTAIEPPTHN